MAFGRFGRFATRNFSPAAVTASTLAHHAKFGAFAAYLAVVSDDAPVPTAIEALQKGWLPLVFWTLFIGVGVVFSPLLLGIPMMVVGSAGVLYAAASACGVDRPPALCWSGPLALGLATLLFAAAMLAGSYAVDDRDPENLRGFLLAASIVVLALFVAGAALAPLALAPIAAACGVNGLNPFVPVAEAVDRAGADRVLSLGLLTGLCAVAISEPRPGGVVVRGGGQRQPPRRLRPPVGEHPRARPHQRGALRPARRPPHLQPPARRTDQARRRRAVPPLRRRGRADPGPGRAGRLPRRPGAPGAGGIGTEPHMAFMPPGLLLRPRGVSLNETDRGAAANGRGRDGEVSTTEDPNDVGDALASMALSSAEDRAERGAERSRRPGTGIAGFSRVSPPGAIGRRWRWRPRRGRRRDHPPCRPS
jgi:hypothetical protein